VITGASGFVGRVLKARLGPSANTLAFGADDWGARLDAARLAGATVFHLAARVHGAGGDAAYTNDNVGKTRRLAEAAVRARARRIVFLSTIKVFGEESPGRPFTLEDTPAPEDAYARSKLAAEQVLTEASRDYGLEVVIVRTPLVYGAGARANLAALMGLVDSPWPLPFESLDAPRSFVHVSDLAQLLVACGEAPQARGRTYVAAHREAVTTARLVSLMRGAMGRPPRLFPMPRAILEAAAALVGKSGKMLRLTRPLQGDPSAAERELGWSAQVPIGEAVEEMVREFRARTRS
jgi:nucleoside-diphosphate-sugar epimerase